VATATRLYARRELGNVADAVVDLCDVLAARAIEAGDTYLPGYTHLQRAQPVLLAHQLLAHGWALLRDVDRLIDTHRRLNSSPLGAGALGGSTLPLEPDAVAAELGFTARFENSIDAVSDRDFVAEALFALSLLAVHLSKMGEEVMLFTTEEFGFYRLDDAWATGSSMLPQKKNPDIAELARGKAGGFIGRLVALLTTLKGTPGGYNRDLQEDKAPLFQGFDEILLELPAVAGLYASLFFDRTRMAAAADDGYLVALDLAEWLVVRGMPFRDAHGAVGGLVREAMQGESTLRELVAASALFGTAALELFDPGSSTVRRRTPGGGGNDAVAEQLVAFSRRLIRERARVEGLAR
jgi:argininosuccinate lyase